MERCGGGGERKREEKMVGVSKRKMVLYVLHPRIKAFLKSWLVNTRGK